MPDNCATRMSIMTKRFERTYVGRWFRNDTELLESRVLVTRAA
jgi:hypothetical protein